MTSEDALISAAWEARKRAYAPYSKFYVGAAIMDAAGRIYTGCNIENISYGLTICAERVALSQWIVAGATSPLVRGVVVADTDEPISPCGACRQVLAEFHPSLPLQLIAKAGKTLTLSLAELLPRPAVGILNTPDPNAFPP